MVAAPILNSFFLHRETFEKELRLYDLPRSCIFFSRAMLFRSYGSLLDGLQIYLFTLK